MRKLLCALFGAALFAGCMTTPGPVEVQLKAVDIDKVEDASGCYLTGRFVDSTFTPLGFMSGPRFFLSVRNLDSGEIYWMGFSKTKDILFYQLPPGWYVVSQAIKEVPIYYENGGEQVKKIHKAPYTLPDVLLSEFQISAGEVIYLGTLTPKDEANKSSIVYDNDYAKTRKVLLRAAYVMVDFTVKPYLEPEEPIDESSDG